MACGTCSTHACRPDRLTLMDRQLSLDVKVCARGLGFDLVGITTADPLPEDGARMAQWVAAGMHGEMDFMSRHMPTAAHPAHVAAGARSIVVVGLAYHWDASEPPSGSLRGRISSYARGTDYHAVMGGKRAALSRFWTGRGAGLHGITWTRARSSTAPSRTAPGWDGLGRTRC